jgi:hypothetical protein
MGGRVISIGGCEETPPVSGLRVLGIELLHGQFAVAVAEVAPTGSRHCTQENEYRGRCWHGCGEGNGEQRPAEVPQVAQRCIPTMTGPCACGAPWEPKAAPRLVGG